jgi:hypothetical protein
MSPRSKGVVGEELPVVILVIILLTVFIFSVITLYQKHLDSADFLEMQRTASSLAEQIFYNNSGIIPDAAFSLPLTNVQVIVNNLETGATYKSGAQAVNANESARGSAAILLQSAGRNYLGRVDVFVTR